MKSILGELCQRVRSAMASGGMEGNPLVRPSQDERFGDYQSNCAMGIAKKLGKRPRDVAGVICDNLSVEDMCEPPEIAGPGFINFRLKPAFLARRLEAIPAAGEGDENRLGIERTTEPKVVVVDLSSVNLAKEMHVGHLRSTIIGDCVCRMLEFAGHTVHRINHVGDWGTQFGMLVAHLRRVKPEVVASPQGLVISDLETFYVEAKTRFDADDEFKKESRDTVVALQSGDEPTLKLWKAFCEESLRHCHKIYDRMDVHLVDRGESFYNDLMRELIDRLKGVKDASGDHLLVESQGALCMFLEGFVSGEGNPLPLILVKSDGGFNYNTSDFAAVMHRVEKMQATRLIYVVGFGGGNKEHFDMLFPAIRKTGWIGEDVSLEYLGFGNMLGPDGRPFKTRTGGTVKLKDLLDEAVSRARQVIVEEEGRSEARASLSAEQVDHIAETVGIAAIKYFDLSHSLSSDYKFDYDTMLAMEGNTAPYLLYAYARVRSIGRKAGVDFSDLPPGISIEAEHPSEIALSRKLLQFAETFDAAVGELRPNILTEYIYELAKTFSRFYDKRMGVRVIDASPESLRLSRLRLCDLTARTLKVGLSLLGIGTLEQM